MKIIGVEKFGGPEALTVLDVADPHAGPGEVRIRVQAAAVSPTDTVLRAGGQSKGDGKLPAVPGMDAAGIIDETDGSGGWQVGDKVMAIALPLGEHGGAYQEYLVAPADSLAHIPAGMDLAEASTLPMNGLTAVQTLEKLDLQPGQSLAVTGAAGTLGNYLVQLAKHAGLVVVADAAEKDRSLVSGLGPDYIVERGDDVAERIREFFPEGVDALADAAVMNEKAAPAVKDNGGFATYRWWQEDPGRGITVHPIAVREEYHSGQKLEALRRLAEDGTLTLRVADRLPAEKAAEAHRRLEAGGVRGRLVLLF
ncbi:MULTISPECIES: NADP-dependent oxidoreductase [Arthrobacter]|uniref:NADP-dependent oxidoreductase n=1 Tax=Arthrobacter sunyaminii TaxID=2816859 RepID=A0A975S664_9MICC|nr:MULTISPECIES: NADP-dependent oxidoreductase [Arthrobacter]MBO0909744.1 NADP-dependent oxidoreductase [Arthrobacter sunyaminii]QWQ36541.1 NADP-dependent oxidoreductase [Arthrobacter sunyaminii]